ncbi:MAG: hypothetical protein ACLUV3_00785 [Oscillospiraceae bacterium]|jgi:hypothetical protein|uniref:hypothetical protein n=1 Tax=Porcipelethomonas sp. TaxID=2981675 RepID=UPI003076B066
MVQLFNIMSDGKYISCDYIPEQSGESGHIVVDLNTEEVSSVTFSNYEYGKKMYIARVRSKLLQLVNSGNRIPSEATAIWY